MHSKLKIFLGILLVSFLLIGCNNPVKKLEGFWENDKKIIQFESNNFVIYNKDSSEIIAFSGTYSFATDPSYVIKMRYENAMDKTGKWFSLEGTDLFNYVDNLLYRIDGDELETKVIANGQQYFYHRIKNPVETSDSL